MLANIKESTRTHREILKIKEIEEYNLSKDI
jgi:hypothetical protein